MKRALLALALSVGCGPCGGAAEHFESSVLLVDAGQATEFSFAESDASIPVITTGCFSSALRIASRENRVAALVLAPITSTDVIAAWPVISWDGGASIQAVSVRTLSVDGGRGLPMLLEPLRDGEIDALQVASNPTKVVLAWQRRATDGGSSIVVAERDASGRWTPPEVVVPQAWVSLSNTVAQDDGTVILNWAQPDLARGFGTEVMVRRRRAGVWLDATRLGPTSESSMGPLRFATNGSELVALWVGAEAPLWERHVFASRLNGDGGWSTEMLDPNMRTQHAVSTVSGVLSPDGGLLAAWRAAGGVVFSSWNGQLTSVDAGSADAFPAVVAFASGLPVVAWPDPPGAFMAWHSSITPLQLTGPTWWQNFVLNLRLWERDDGRVSALWSFDGVTEIAVADGTGSSLVGRVEGISNRTNERFTMVRTPAGVVWVGGISTGTGFTPSPESGDLAAVHCP